MIEDVDVIAAGDATARASMPPGTAQWAYASLALGSALAVFMYPHTVTAVLSTRSRLVIRRNAALLPSFTLLLGPAVRFAAHLRENRGTVTTS